MINKTCKLEKTKSTWYHIQTDMNCEVTCRYKYSRGCVQLEETWYLLQPSPSSKKTKLAQHAKCPKVVYLWTILCPNTIRYNLTLKVYLRFQESRAQQYTSLKNQ